MYLIFLTMNFRFNLIFIVSNVNLSHSGFLKIIMKKFDIVNDCYHILCKRSICFFMRENNFIRCLPV